MRIFNGKKAAEKILLDLKKKIEREKVKPKLAVILVGENKASKLYIKNKKQAAKKIGIKVIQYKFKKDARENNIIQKIKDLNNDRSINGIIVQLPLPEGFKTRKITETINPEKDVDGFHKVNRNLLKKGKPYFFPVLPLAILIALKRTVKDFQRRKILALVNSDALGQTLKTFLKREGIKINYLLRKKVSFLKIKKELKSADIIITVCGCPNLIKGDMIKNKAILIDAGISYSFNGRVKGDVDREGLKNKAAFLTPVPGGIGPLTVASLLKNVYLSAKKYEYRKTYDFRLRQDPDDFLYLYKL